MWKRQSDSCGDLSSTEVAYSALSRCLYYSNGIKSDRIFQKIGNRLGGISGFRELRIPGGTGCEGRRNFTFLFRFDGE